MIHKRDAGETSRSGYALNLETRGRGNNRNSNWADQNLEILIRTEVNLDQANKYNAGIRGKQVMMRITKHSRIHCMFQLGLLLKQDPRRSKKHLMG